MRFIKTGDFLDHYKGHWLLKAIVLYHVRWSDTHL